MHPDALTAAEQRVLGCLIEKRWTTPDQYPLSVNALRLACNQATNRDPVTAFDETTVRDAAQRLCRYGLARLASGHTSRAIKYRHLAEEALGLDRQSLALVGVLLLRGPQTPGELKGRSERMAHFDSLAQVDITLATLAERHYVRSLGRRPGQKEDRFMHLLGSPEEGPSAETATPPQTATPPPTATATATATPPPAAAPPPPAVPPPPAARLAVAPSPGLDGRVTALEVEIIALREELAALREQLAARPAEPGARFER